MKLRWIIVAGLVLLAGYAVLLLRPRSGPARLVAETRRALRAQGFKTDLADFNFSAPAELSARAAVLTNADILAAARLGADRQRLSVLPMNRPELMAAASADSAIVVWREAVLPSRPDGTDDLWLTLREIFEDYARDLDEAARALLAGPFKFNLNASHGNAMLLPHLASLKSVTRLFAVRALLDLHDGNNERAWTNLLAATRVATAYQVEPGEISQLVQDACATIAWQAAWQSLQTNTWSEERLARLQREWEAVDFFKTHSEAIAFQGASMVATCRQERRRPVGGLGISLLHALRSPRTAWQAATAFVQRVQYRHKGSYEDENGLLLHFRDRQSEMQRAIKAGSWQEMRMLPGVTNQIPFRSKYNPAWQSLFYTRQLMIAAQSYAAQGQAPGVLGRAAEAETRRRLILGAIGLERFRIRHDAYPKSLADLVPEFWKQVPVDFMDGQPLRYHLTDDGHFVLYSVGADCVDDGGMMPDSLWQAMQSQPTAPHSFSLATDLIWPRPASTAAVERFRADQTHAFRDNLQRGEEARAQEQWEESARRQAGVAKLLTSKPAAPATEPALRRRPLSELLRNEKTAGTDKPSLFELLTLRQVFTGAEPETVTFEVPLAFDALKDIATPELQVDPVSGDEDADFEVGSAEWSRATNGNCLVTWKTIYEAPGQHALRVVLDLDEEVKPFAPFAGPILPFAISNLCQFSLASAYFNSASGGTFRAKLPELRADFSVEISTLAGERVRTLSGSTTNGVLVLHWDLMDDAGRRAANQEYNTLFHITLPDSGRTQTLKGP